MGKCDLVIFGELLVYSCCALAEYHCHVETVYLAAALLLTILLSVSVLAAYHVKQFSVGGFLVLNNN